MSLLEASFLSNLKLLIYHFKIHTRWKELIPKLEFNLFKLVSFNISKLIPLLLSIIFLSKFVSAGPAKLVLYQGFKKLEINTKQCRAGIYMKNPSMFTCACVTGVWGFYPDYCSKPLSIVGGDNYCFRMKNHSISQVVAFGSLKYPFEASLSIFQKGFFQMTESHNDDNSTHSEPTSSFLTITDTSWTVYSETGDALCLKATTTGKRKFCLFGEEINVKPRDWKYIMKIKKGCLSKNIRRADSCSDILPPNDYTDCSLDLLQDIMTEPSNEIDGNATEYPRYIPIRRIDIDDDDTQRFIPIRRINTDNNGSDERFIPIKNIDTSQEVPKYIPVKVIDTDKDRLTLLDNMTSSEEVERFIPIKKGDTSEESEKFIPIKVIDTSEESEKFIPIKVIDTDKDRLTLLDNTTSSEEIKRFIPIKSVDTSEESEKFIPIKVIDPDKDNSTSSEEDERFIPINRINDTSGSSEENPHPGWIKIKPKKVLSSSSSSEEWIPIYRFPPSTTEEPEMTISSTTEYEEEVTTPKQLDLCDTDLTREKVKEYWLDPANNECSKSINEAVFTDQLRRFTVKQFDTIFQSRLKSLAQMETMLNYTKLIMQKTCGEDYVPGDFFQVAFSAFMMFIREDFFYGVEGATPDVYPRILKTLKKCLDRAEPYVFETDTLDCGMKKINGHLILPGKRDKLEIPVKSASESFEPLIETMWKMFLNTHSLCFSDFQFSNDHHHFSVLIMELFSKSIYEKWIEPLESRELYSFILPNYNFLKETMENIDYCVAATNKVSVCPAWMSRSGSGVPTSSRKKRSIWVDKEAQDKKRSEVWDGEAYCMQKMEDPEIRLGMKDCTPAF